MTPHEAMHRIDALLTHVWMARTFIKHSEEAEEDEELQEIHRDLYDAMHALGPAWQAGDPTAYLNQARKKIGKLRRAAQRFADIQPEVSAHMNFQMAVRSLNDAVEQVASTLEAVGRERPGSS